jgi:hypothetical protein
MHWLHGAVMRACIDDIVHCTALQLLQHSSGAAAGVRVVPWPIAVCAYLCFTLGDLHEGNIARLGSQ